MWRPKTEAEATSNIAVFVEWLRATQRRPDADPDDVLEWWRRAPEALLQAVADFAGETPRDADDLADLARRLLIDDERPRAG